MSERKVRILFFVLGLAVGIILGASVVRVYIDKVNAENSVSKSFVSKLFSNIVGLVYKPKVKSDTVVVVNDNANSANAIISDSTQINDGTASSNASLASADTVSESKPNSKAEPNEVVIADKLIAASRIQVIEVAVENSKKDSTHSAKKNLSVYAIEYWQSPLNYRGYKTQKNKIILYGLNKDESLKLLRLKDRLYLKFQNQYSAIDNYSDYHSFEKVFDQQTLNLLNAVK
jgi:hypothetical protein